MDEVEKEALVSEFRSYLDRLEQPFDTLSGSEPDLDILMRELTTLKNEIKIESRLIKRGLENFEHQAAARETEYQTVTGSLQALEQQCFERCGRETMRPLIMDLLDLYDRLEAGCSAAKKTRETFRSRIFGGRKRLLRSFASGQEMNLKRLVDILETCGVIAFKCVGEQFDPARMRAVAMDENPSLDDGMVSVELRKGFYWNGDVARYAEVKVNRRAV
ncbi:nucleotide exchange factor GrpE [Desulfomarina sp.]